MKNAIRNWLGIKDYTSTIDEINDKLASNADTIKKQSKAIENIESGQHGLKQAYEYQCDGCGLTFMKWPFGGGYYKEHDGSLLHDRACLDKWLENKK